MVRLSVLTTYLTAGFTRPFKLPALNGIAMLNMLHFVERCQLGEMAQQEKATSTRLPETVLSDLLFPRVLAHQGCRLSWT
jgi:hypothetical protein